MKISLYKNLSDNIKVNKELVEKADVSDIKLYEPVDILNPVFEIEAFAGVENYNYIYFPHFDRYYFARVVLQNHKAIFSCNVDVLMSHPDSFMNTQQMINRCETKRDKMLVDSSIPMNVDGVLYTRRFGEAITNHFTYILGVI